MKLAPTAIWRLLDWRMNMNEPLLQRITRASCPNKRQWAISFLFFQPQIQPLLAACSLLEHPLPVEPVVPFNMSDKWLRAIWSKTVGNMWQLSNLFTTWCCFASESFDFLWLSHCSKLDNFKTWRHLKHAQATGSSTVGVLSTATTLTVEHKWKRHLVSENMSVSYIQTNCTNNSAAQGTTQNQDNTL